MLFVVVRKLGLMKMRTVNVVRSLTSRTLHNVIAEAANVYITVGNLHNMNFVVTLDVLLTKIHN